MSLQLNQDQKHLLDTPLWSLIPTLMLFIIIDIILSNINSELINGSYSRDALLSLLCVAILFILNNTVRYKTASKDTPECCCLFTKHLITRRNITNPWVEVIKKLTATATITFSFADFALRYMNVAIYDTINSALEVNTMALSISVGLTIATWSSAIAFTNTTPLPENTSTKLNIFFFFVFGCLFVCNLSLNTSTSTFTLNDEQHTFNNSYIIYADHNLSELVYPALRGSPILAAKMLSKLTYSDFSNNDGLELTIASILKESILHDQKTKRRNLKSFIKIPSIYHHDDLAALEHLLRGDTEEFLSLADKIYKEKQSAQRHDGGSFSIELATLLVQSGIIEAADTHKPLRATTSHYNEERRLDVRKMINAYNAILQGALYGSANQTSQTINNIHKDPTTKQ